MAVEIKGPITKPLSGLKKWLGGVIGSSIMAAFVTFFTKWLISQGIDAGDAATTAGVLGAAVILPILTAILGETAVDRARAKNGPKEGGNK